MRIFLTVLIALFYSFSFGQYPIKTIFKGDSVVILTVSQSNSINSSIEKSSKTIRDLRAKIKSQEDTILQLKRIIRDQDSARVSQRGVVDTLVSRLEKCEGSMNQCEEVYDSLWIWALGPSLIYTQYPDDDTVYILDLSRYYMTTDDFGIIMPRMSDKEYEKYKEFVQKYGMDQKAIWEFKNDIDIKSLPKDEIMNRKVWKYKKKWK
jgi:hypothetical protein